MSGDGTNDVNIPLVFLFHKEGKILHDAVAERPGIIKVMLVDKARSDGKMVVIVFVSPELSSVRDYVITHSVRSMYVVCMYVVICKIDHCIHIHWCIPMGLGYNDPWVESHMWPQQTWGQRSSRGQWPLVQVFGKKDQCIHILWCIFKSNITMIAKVCDRESRWDSWFENRLVILSCQFQLLGWF